MAERLDGLAAWALGGPVTVILAVLCGFQLAAWVPHYLTWPWWSDLDAYAGIAQGWDVGRLPYRDIVSNNFPGQIYLIYLLGRAVGWGQPAALYAVDAGFVAVLGVLMLSWSRRRLGGLLPGLVGYAAFLTYYLGLDYTQVAQRDWHGPFFATAALLLIETWPGRWARLGSALAFAAALTFRPQVVLLLPAVVLALDEGVRDPGESLGRLVRPLLGWGVALAVGLILAFFPLVWAGVLDDFVRDLRLVGYGAAYNQVGLGHVLKVFVKQIAPAKVVGVPLAISLLVASAPRSVRRLAGTWGVALLGVLAYKPLSPAAHAYLDHPLMLIWAVNLAVLTHLIVESRALVPTLRLAAVLLVAMVGVTLLPDSCRPEQSVRACAALWAGQETKPAERPVGYRARLDIPTAAQYPWRDVHNLLDHLRRTTTARTSVANCLCGPVALNGPLGRLSPFPSETSVCWLAFVRPQDEPAFASALATATEAVVVWSPTETDRFPEIPMARLGSVIRRHYEPEARFGDLEVWRRKSPATAAR